ncbi:hypothetical protein BSG1_08956 [Bacillus sp. SG-1]|nr:hypothetical protein BSG1_08956 [Bacillus sp. SG-1]
MKHNYSSGEFKGEYNERKPVFEYQQVDAKKPNG